MPVPIVPAPMTPIGRDLSRRRRVGHVGNSRRRPLREKRVAQRARLGRLHELEEHLAARRRDPRRTASFTAAATASMHRCGAGWFLRFDAPPFRAPTAKSFAASGQSMAMSRTRLSPAVFRRRPCAAKASAPSRKSPSTIASKSRVSRNSAAATLAPLTIIRSALSTPTTRGSRCVPPAPGRIPSFTSGKCDGGVRRARRAKWQPSASSSPPPMHVAAIAATTGLPLASTVRITASSVGSAVDLGVLNSRMSAPPENALPAPMSTMTSIAGSAFARSMARRRTASRVA